MDQISEVPYVRFHENVVVDWFMKQVGGLDMLINVAILTGTFWQPGFVNTLVSGGLSIQSFIIYVYSRDC